VRVALATSLDRPACQNTGLQTALRRAAGAFGLLSHFPRLAILPEQYS
jgi:hypothetical protein